MSLLINSSLAVSQLDFTNLSQSLKKRAEDSLTQYLSPQLTTLMPISLFEALRYVVLNGGKRLRPLLVYIVGKCLGTPLEHLDAAAIAIELIHCYSLVHDDLPAMDNDDFRRGQPTCHKAFDEATAILVGDALQSLAYEILVDDKAAILSPEKQLKLIRVLAKAAGPYGMVAGQALDIAAEAKPCSLEALHELHRLKTGALISASVQMGIDSSNCSDMNLIHALQQYAENIGLAFQVQDDVLDVKGSLESLGKQPGSDALLQKATFPALLGLAEAEQYADSLYHQAVQGLMPYPQTKALWHLVDALRERNH
jgi:geranylgeranyl pyrophosphate synthase